MSNLLVGNEVYQIMGAAMEVHRVLGPGFLEAVYQEAMEIELRSREIPFHPHHPFRIRYKDVLLDKYYTPDLLCHESIVVELKAASALTSSDVAQLLNYLKAARLRVGLLINFGVTGRIQWKRFVM